MDTPVEDLDMDGLIGRRVKIVNPEENPQAPDLSNYSLADWAEAKEYEGRIGVVKKYDFDDELANVDFEDDWSEFYREELVVLEDGEEPED